MFKASLFRVAIAAGVTMAVAHLILVSVPAEAVEMSTAKSLMSCGSYPVFENYEDSNGGFIYRKNVIQWQQGHENAEQPMTMTANLKGQDCTLQVKFAKITKTFKYKICDVKREADGDCDHVFSFYDMTPPLPASGKGRTCQMGPEHKHALSNCKVPTPKTKFVKKYIPPACRKASTGVLMEPYTCTPLSKMQKESLENYGAKLCSGKGITDLCSSKVKCVWNNSIPRNGHILSFDSFVYCPAQAGGCNIDPMTCGADRDLYFEDPATVEEMFKAKYNIPAEQGGSAK